VIHPGSIALVVLIAVLCYWLLMEVIAWYRARS